MKLKQTSLLALLFLSILSWDKVASKKFMRCELSRELVRKYRINKTFISNWICLLEHESDLDTEKVTTKPNGSTNHGLFQISSKDWCRKGRRGGQCNTRCEDFIDENITDDVECALKIFDAEGFKHWRGWNVSCSNPQNLPNLRVVCNLT